MELGVVLVCAILAVCGNLLLKLGMNGIGSLGASGRSALGYWVEVFTTPIILLGFLFYATSSLLWLAVLPRLEMNRFYPFFTAAAFVLMTLASYFVLRERISPMTLVGLAVICLGLVVVSRG